jgi:hypothetical protein
VRDQISHPYKATGKIIFLITLFFRLPYYKFSKNLPGYNPDLRDEKQAPAEYGTAPSKQNPGKKRFLTRNHGNNSVWRITVEVKRYKRR